MMIRVADLPRQDRKTPPRLTIYEKTRIQGERMSMLDEKGCRPLIKVVAGENTQQIAAREIREGKLRLSVRRRFPNGKSVDCPLYDLVQVQE